MEAYEPIGKIRVFLADEQGDPAVANAVRDALDDGIAAHVAAWTEPHPEGALIALAQLDLISNQIVWRIGPVGHRDNDRITVEMRQAALDRVGVAMAALVVDMSQPEVRLPNAL